MSKTRLQHEMSKTRLQHEMSKTRFQHEMSKTRFQHDVDPGAPLWLERLRLTDFRNYETLSLELDTRPVVLTGPNGAGKTNLLEAVSLLAPGRGLRGQAFADLARLGGSGLWAVSGRVNTQSGLIEIGTGLELQPAGRTSSGRIVKIDGQAARGSGALADILQIVWLTPALDGLFTGPAGERRRFLDRLILGLDPAYRRQAGRFERAMRQRNRLLETGERNPALFEGLEMQMAESGVVIASARMQAVDQLGAAIHARWSPDTGADTPFPWSTLALDGALEQDLRVMAAVDAEDSYAERLRQGRDRDRAAKRTLTGPHRSDFIVGHGPKQMSAKLCSTGEQKALLVGMMLAYARLVAEKRAGAAPIILLDEIAAHLDETRRSALFAEIIALNAQAWMTGTDAGTFAPFGLSAQYFAVDDGGVSSAAIG